MSVLIIGQKEKARIREVIEHARSHVMPLAIVRGAIPAHEAPGNLKLADRDPKFVRPPSAHVIFPGGIRATFSIEMQPDPVGLCSHLSVSVPKKGKMPNVHVVRLICEEFGVPFPPDIHGWNEEFDLGHFAVNLLSIWRDNVSKEKQ